MVQFGMTTLVRRALLFASVAALATVASAQPSASSTSATVEVRTPAELAAALKRAGAGAGAGQVRTIRLLAGRYVLTAPIVIDSRMSGTSDAPFTLEAARGARVELSGARALPDLRWEGLSGGVWRARLVTAPFQRLWRGDAALIRARYPNYDPAVLSYGGVAADAASPARVTRWANPAGGMLQALHGSQWGDVHVPILGKNADGTLRYGPVIGNNRAA